jgi:ATP-binding protein involved in chromosome partitioning
LSQAVGLCRSSQAALALRALIVRPARVIHKWSYHPMRIAIPITGDCLEPHFGHCEKFAFIDVDAGTRQVTASTETAAPEHQPGLLPPWLKERGVTHIIAGNMGGRARSLLQEVSVEVLTGAPAKSAAILVRKYLDGTLVTSENTCNH